MIIINFINNHGGSRASTWMLGSYPKPDSHWLCRSQQSAANTVSVAIPKVHEDVISDSNTPRENRRIILTRARGLHRDQQDEDEDEDEVFVE